MKFSENCYRFAAFLFNYESDVSLNAKHESTDAPEDDLRKWGITSAERSVARAVALEARRRGKDPASLLAKAEKFFNDFTRDAQTGRRVYHIQDARVGGASRREGL